MRKNDRWRKMLGEDSREKQLKDGRVPVSDRENKAKKSSEKEKLEKRGHGGDYSKSLRERNMKKTREKTRNEGLLEYTM